MSRAKDGSFHLNTQRAMHHDKMMSIQKPGKSMEKKAEEGMSQGGGMKAPEMDGADHSELHDNGDGSFKTVVGGEETQHPHIGHALMHMASHHDPESKHMHIHHDGMTATAHKAQGGSVEGPEEHDGQNLDSLKDSMDQFLSEEKQEDKHGEDPEMQHMGDGMHGGLY